MEFFVDFQGFRGPNNEFLVKEYAALCLQDNHHVAHLFKPKYAWDELTKKNQKTNTWLTKYLHGLKWNSGYLPYDTLEDVILATLYCASIIYVKGKDKKKFLDEILEKSCIVRDLETDLRCPSWHELPHFFNMICLFHRQLNSLRRCALDNVELLKNWFVKVSEEDELSRLLIILNTDKSE